MRGDDGQPMNTVTGDDLRERRGPRHAAPRKSLLTKLQIPAGKAFALAAMPTAVFVGMGLTPKLAMADDTSDIPFAPGPCVTRSDEPAESQEPEPTATPTPSATASTTPSAGATEPAGKPDATGPAAPEPSASSTAPATTAQDKPAATPTATPEPTATKNPFDPLGVGDALKDLFDGPDKETASPSPAPTTESPAPAETAPEKTAPTTPADTADEAKDPVDRTADAIRDAADRAGKQVEELDEDVKGLDPVKDEDIPDGAKERFPCPTPDPEALAAADLEQGIPLLPNEPWVLESTMLTLNGLDYKGIVEVKRSDGSIKKVLKFTASSIDIKDLHQLTVGPAGTTGHVTSDKGSTSTIRNGEVTMYTEELKGNLFGLIPVTFSPQTPPPLNVPFAFFTKVKVTQAGQFGGSLRVPGLSNYFTGGNS
ncbi:hypothetical protein F0344_09705 [Streptomyces finlayi]|uniref:Hydrogenase expression protein HypF n=1 Tax=Streptomyces finlayi TaxID=67296 RepID=A0A7G7BHN7_9ACTN|nr:hypothetical protein [Streptomyces finlayi]QNE74852.1 hypothetical protein F0344_09705 [Streptomyces finlayi]